MQLLSVYVEGAKDSSAEGIRRVASQIAARYGLSAPELERRLAAGRFRVKANVDEETASAFAEDLESLGARCTIVAAGGNPASRSAVISPRIAHAGSTLTGMQPLDPQTLDDRGPRIAPAPPPVLARPGGFGEPAQGAAQTPAPTVTPPLARVATPGPSAAPPAPPPPLARVATPGPSAAPPAPPPPLARVATPGPSAAPPAPPPPLARVATPGPSAAPPAPPAETQPTAPSSTAPPPLTSRTMTLPMGSLPMRPAAETTPRGASAQAGLAAALADATFTSGSAELDTGALSLAALDERAAPPLASRPAAAHAPLALEPDPRHLAPDRFAPPPELDARHAPLALEPDPRHLAPDRFAPPPEQRWHSLEAPHLVLEAPRPARGQLAVETPTTSGPAVAAPYTPASPARASARRGRGRLAFISGVFVAMALGFAPAHLMARARERTAYEKIDNRVRAAQSGIATQEEWKALDDIRTARMRDKRGAQQEIALLAVLLWVGVSASLAAAWTRWGVPRFSSVDER